MQALSPAAAHARVLSHGAAGPSKSNGACGALRRAAPRHACARRARAAATTVSRAGGMREQMAAVKDVRAQMDANPDLATLMAGLRGSNINESDFAADGVEMVTLNSVATSGGGDDVLPLEYDPAAIARFWERRPGAVAQRILQLLSISGRFLSNLAWDAFRGQLKETEVARAIELRDIVTSLGPAYIKLGQALSIRPDLLSPAAMRELQKLCDKVPSFPNDVAMKLIEEELGAPWPEFYSELGPEPVAAASLGQVYKGVLRTTGETVAVKVQRPYVLETVTVDLYVIRRLGLFLRRFPEISTDVVGLLDEWAARFFEELDYVREGSNATRFAAMMAVDLPQIVVPRTYAQYTARRVLTSGWLEGEKLSQSTADDVGDLVGVGVIAYLKQLLDNGFFHAVRAFPPAAACACTLTATRTHLRAACGRAFRFRREQDPHPGNLIRTPDGRLAILDFGLMTEISDDVKYGMVEAISHLIHRDYEAIVEDFVTLDFIPPGVDLKPLLPVLARVFDSALEGGGARTFNFQELAADLAQITFDYPFRIPPYFALIIRAIGVLEGIALVGNPDFALVDEAYPYISKRLLTDSSPRLRASLTYMVYGKSKVFDADRLIDILESYESFVTVSRFGSVGAGGPAALLPANSAAAHAASPSASSPLSALPSMLPAGFGVAPMPMPALVAPGGAPGSNREALTFLFSAEGEFFRDFILDELVKGIDASARVQAADAVNRLGLGGVRLPVLIPFAASRSVALAPLVTADDRAVVENCAKLIAFLSGSRFNADAALPVLTPRVINDLLPVLPRVAAEMAPQLAQRLGSRVTARFLREVMLDPAYL
jgi:aarF domain-containing kinase